MPSFVGRKKKLLILCAFYLRSEKIVKIEESGDKLS